MIDLERILIVVLLYGVVGIRKCYVDPAFDKSQFIAAFINRIDVINKQILVVFIEILIESLDCGQESIL